MGCKLIEEEDQDEFFVVIALHILFASFVCVCVFQKGKVTAS